MGKKDKGIKAVVENETPTEEDKEYSVEKILEKKVDDDGNALYLIKWENYDSKFNTWEPIENLDCGELLQEFELNWNKDNKVQDTTDKKRKIKEVLDSLTTQSKKSKSEEDRPRGFDRNLAPDRIIGATDTSGELMFLIKWEGCEEADLVPAKIANLRCPQTVIKFYEERLTWHTGANAEDEDKKKD